MWLGLVMFCLSGLVLFGGYLKLWVYLVATFGYPEIGICISLIVSELVLLLEFHEVGFCMTWVVLNTIGWNDWWYACSLYTVWMLSPYYAVCIMIMLCLLIWSVCMFCYFFIYEITWYIYGVGIMGYILVGVLFFCICTATYVCISYCPNNVYPCGIIYFPSFIFCMLIFLDSHMPGFFFFPIVWNLSTIGWKLWGGYAYVFHHMQLYVHFEICLLDMNYSM